MDERVREAADPLKLVDDDVALEFQLSFVRSMLPLAATTTSEVRARSAHPLIRLRLDLGDTPYQVALLAAAYIDLDPLTGKRKWHERHHPVESTDGITAESHSRDLDLGPIEALVIRVLNHDKNLPDTPIRFEPLQPGPSGPPKQKNGRPVGRPSLFAVG